MARYLHLFENEDDYNAARLNDYKEPWVSATNLGGGEATPPYRVDYNKSEYEKLLEKLLETPLTFEIVCGGTLYWYNSGNTGDIKTIEYKLNDGEWTEITSSKDNDGSGTTIATVITGDIIKFRGNNDTYCNFYMNRCSCFRNTSDCYFYAYGNIMSLINYNNFKTNKKLTGGSTFAYLFNNTGIMSHPVKKLLLPATTLTQHCYEYMFADCTSLEKAPELPATALAKECYRCMFQGCTSLVNAPELPATALADDCYGGMFWGCTSLVNAPTLPATALADSCYEYMFQGCTSLNYIKCLATDIPHNRCTQEWVRGVASTGTFVKNASMASWTTGTSGIPTGWTVQDATN